MKKEDTFLLVSLEENKAKKLAQVISNDTSRKILDALANHDSTETELSGSLQIPMSTVHYNLKQLTETGLVVAKEFHYSEKGKEVNHYSLANKFIIIAPKSQEGITLKIKRALPIALFAAGITAIGYYLSSLLKPALPIGINAETAGLMAAKVAAPAIQASAPSYEVIALWFLFGALFSMASFVCWEWIRERIAR